MTLSVNPRYLGKVSELEDIGTPLVRLLVGTINYYSRRLVVSSYILTVGHTKLSTEGFTVYK